MIVKELKLIFRNLLKSKITSAINIIGFAFSISICFIIAIYVANEFSYNKFHKNYNNIYRVVNNEEQQSNVDYTIKNEILSTIPEVRQYCHILYRNYVLPIQHQKKTININHCQSADNNFFKVFSFPLILGNPEKPFTKDKHSILISQSVAQELFGDENPMGKKVKLHNRTDYFVCGVFKDFPENSSMYADVIRNETYEINKRNNSHNEDGKSEYIRNVFLTLDDPSKIKNVTRKINSQLASKDKFLKQVWLQPFKDIYMFDKSNCKTMNKGNYALVKLFIAIAIITLVLACINYINLSIVQSNKRTKETGVRKTLGARRILLIKSFLLESVVISAISMVIAVVLSILFLPFFNSLFDLNLNHTRYINVPIVLGFMIIVFVFGIVNGIWPALILSSYNPIHILQKRFMRINGKNYLPKVFTTVQYVTSISLITCVLFVAKQLNFMKQKELGFNDSYLLKIVTYHLKDHNAFKNTILQNPYVLGATYSSGIPGDINWGRGAGMHAASYEDGVSVIGSDSSFIQTCQINLVEGRNFHNNEKTRVCLINQTALKEFGWNNDWENKLFNKQGKSAGYKVIGVFKDFHFRSLYTKIKPLVISNEDYQKSFLTLRLSPDNFFATMQYIKDTWNEIEPDVPLNYTFYDAWFDSMYKKEERLANMITTFAVLAIIISCLGIFGQAIINITNRIKEIGIRKVNGAKISEVLTMLNKDFIKWVVIAFVIACPTAYYTMNKWLENFAYKTELSWWIFALAGFLALGIAILTVSWQSWRAATRNPVEALRYE